MSTHCSESFHGLCGLLSLGPCKSSGFMFDHSPLLLVFPKGQMSILASDLCRACSIHMAHSSLLHLTPTYLSGLNWPKLRVCALRVSCSYDPNHQVVHLYCCSYFPAHISHSTVSLRRAGPFLPPYSWLCPSCLAQCQAYGGCSTNSCWMNKG